MTMTSKIAAPILGAAPNTIQGAVQVLAAATLALVPLAALSPSAQAAKLKVTIDNLAPVNGIHLTPVWIGFHTGEFDLYNRGESLDLFPGFEALVEDGVNAPTAERFAREAPAGTDGSIFGANGPIAPGETVSLLFDVDLSAAMFFSYASMIVPSNDAFIANGNPQAFPLFNATGKFIGADFTVLGTNVLDGGTEVNDEVAFSTAFLGQQTPDTGVDENGVVTEHPGFVPGGRILTATNFGPRSLSFTSADFTAPGYQVARIRVEQVPEPGLVLGLIAFGSSAWAVRRRQAA